MLKDRRQGETHVGFIVTIEGGATPIERMQPHVEKGEKVGLFPKKGFRRGEGGTTSLEL